MTTTREMLQAIGRPGSFDEEELATAIDACADNELTCTACADASLAEDDVADLRDCITLCVTCADLCAFTGRLLSRRAREDRFLTTRVLQACVHFCHDCAAECQRHAAHHKHCGVCAKACRACEQACRELLDEEAQEELRAIAGG
jgi:hypothetical protein